MSCAREGWPGYQEPEHLSRVLAHLRMYVHRSTQLGDNFRLTESLTKYVAFFRYLSSSIPVAQGRVACPDERFLARQESKLLNEIAAFTLRCPETY